MNTCNTCNNGGRKKLSGRRTKNKRSRKNYRGGSWFSTAGNTVGETTTKIEEGLSNVGKSIGSTASSSWSNVSNWFSSSKPKETSYNPTSYNPMYNTSSSNTVGGKRTTRYRKKNKHTKKTRKH